MPPAKLSARWPGTRTDQADDLRTAIAKLLSTADALKQSLMPQSIIAGNALFSALREIFAMLLGVHGSFMSSARFRDLYLNSDRGAKDAARDPLRCDDDWVGRFLPGAGGFTLPGWSPIMMRTSLGAVVRKGGT